MFNICNLSSSFKFSLFYCQSFWRDEAFTALMIRSSFWDILKITSRDFNPPLYYYLIKVWSNLFGTSELALRNFSVICFLIGLYILYKISREIFSLGKFATFILITLYLTSPNIFYLAFEARMYGLFSMLTLLLIYYWYKRKSIYFMITTSLILLTHYYSIFVISTIFLFNFLKKKINFIYFILGFLIASPWYIYTLQRLLSQSKNFWINYSQRQEFPKILGRAWNGYEPVWGFFDKYEFVSSFLIFLCILLIIRNSRSRIRSLFSFEFFLGFVMPYIIFFLSFWKPLYVPRYLVYTNIGQLLFFGKNFAYLSKINIALIAILLLSNSQIYNDLALTNKSKGLWKTSTINAQIQYPDKNLNFYTRSATEYFTLSYYLDSKRVFILDDEARVPYYVGLALIPSSAFIGANPTFLAPGIIFNDDRQYSLIK